MCEDGYILLWKKINECDALEAERFDKFHAWVDLLLMADKEGNVTFSYRDLSEKWGWSVSQVHRFIKKLQSEKMVTETKGGTLFGTHQTLVNYGFYQGAWNAFWNTEMKEETDRKERSKEKITKEESKAALLNAGAHAREGSAPDRKKIPPLVEWVRDYCEKEGFDINPDAFMDYYAQQEWRLSNGNKMKDWQAAVRTWVHRNEERKAKPPAQKQNQFSAGVMEHKGFDYDEFARRNDALGGL